MQNKLNQTKSNPSIIEKQKVLTGLDPLNIIKQEKEQKKKEEKRKQKMFSNFPDIDSLIPNKASEEEQTDEFNEQKKEMIEVKKEISEQSNINVYLKSAQQEKSKMKTIDKKQIEKRCNLLMAEKVKEHQQASYKSYDKNLIGILVITNFRLIFCFDNELNKNKMNFHPNYFNFAHFQMEKVVKVQEKEGIFSVPIDVILKDTRVIRFHIWDKAALKFYNAIITNCFPRDPYNYFAFTLDYKNALFENNAYYFNGWDLYDPIKEFKRQGVTEVNVLNLRFCNANKEFKLCATYPRFLIVHNEMTDEQLVEASQHRTKSRFPVLCYYYGRAKNKNIKACPSIWRSSQTKSGITGNNKSNMDIMLLEKITKLCAKLYIFDARPYINALANRVNGGGFENVNHYSNADIIFCEIDNIHVARNSLTKINQLCLSSKM